MRRSGGPDEVAIRGDMGRYGEIWGDMRPRGGGARRSRAVEKRLLWSEVGPRGGDTGRYGEIWGDMGRYCCGAEVGPRGARGGGDAARVVRAGGRLHAGRSGGDRALDRARRSVSLLDLSSTSPRASPQAIAYSIESTEKFVSFRLDSARNRLLKAPDLAEV